MLPVGAQPPMIPRGTSEEDPIDILDSDDELFVELNLTPDQKRELEGGLPETEVKPFLVLVNTHSQSSKIK